MCVRARVWSLQKETLSEIKGISSKHYDRSGNNKYNDKIKLITLPRAGVA